MKLAVLLLAAALLFGTAAQAATGSLLLVGGGDIPPEIAARFVALAGGADRRFVYIPTAATDDQIDPIALAGAFRTQFGVARVIVVHTRDPKIADQPGFTAPIEAADGVWFGGGRQWRIADAYLDTRTVVALRGVLQRGGVVGGTSAGASILASYLVRGAPATNTIVAAPGHERGFGLLPNTAVDQHVDRYHREDDIAPIVRDHPDILGIGLDEATGVAVIDGLATVIGAGRVIVHDGKPHCGLPYAVLRAGDRITFGAALTRPCD